MAGVIKTVTPFLRGAGHFCVGAFDYERANEEINLKVSAGALAAGTALGIVLGAATVTPAAKAGNTGNGTFAATPTVDASGAAGVYTVTVIEPALNGGTFEVSKPDGAADGTGTIGVAYNGTINFTLNDGATDFVAGDQFTVTVAYNAAETWGAWNPAATDGLQNFKGFLWDDRPNVAAVQRAVATRREATVNAHAITGWADLSSDNQAALIAAAKALGIIILL